MLFLWKYKISRGRKIHSENGHHDASEEVSKILKPSATYTPGSGFGMLEGDFLCFRTLLCSYLQVNPSIIKHQKVLLSIIDYQ